LATAALTSIASSGTTLAIEIAASLLQPIFDGGRLRGQKAVAESRERELVETYRKAILSAFADVEEALAGTTRLGQQEQLQADVQRRAHRSRCSSRRSATRRAPTTCSPSWMRSAPCSRRRTSSRRSSWAGCRPESVGTRRSAEGGARRRRRRRRRDLLGIQAYELPHDRDDRNIDVGKMSVGVRRITTGLAMRMSRASTMNVCGGSTSGCA